MAPLKNLFSMKSFNELTRVAICMLAALLLLEFGMRGAGERFQASFYIPERERGYGLRPGAEGWNVGEQENYVRINSNGMRDREHDLKRPDNTIRIAVLGDSETEAVQVPLERTYFSALERELSSAMAPEGRKVEVLSFGVGGYGLGPQYITLKQRVWQYDPQIVILADPIDALILRSSRRLYPGEYYDAPFFDLHNGKLGFDRQTVEWRAGFAGPNPRQAWTADLMNQSRLLSLVNSARVKAGKNVRQAKAAFRPQAKSISPYPEDYWQTFPLLGPATADLKEAWAIGEALILAMQDESARHEAEFWLFILDAPPQVDPDPQERERFQMRLGVGTLFRSDQLLSDFAVQAKIRHQALAPELARIAADRNIVLHGFKGRPKNTGHLNETGHMVVGQLIARTLREHSAVLSKESLLAWK
jgi:hypothetical protein